MIIYEIQDLQSARDFLKRINKKIILSNKKGTTKYYGMRVIDCMFRILQKEFPNKISGVFVNIYDDYSAFITAKQNGYKNCSFDRREKN